LVAPNQTISTSEDGDGACSRNVGKTSQLEAAECPKKKSLNSVAAKVSRLKLEFS